MVSFNLLLAVGLALHVVRWRIAYQTLWDGSLDLEAATSPGWHLLAPGWLRWLVVLGGPLAIVGTFVRRTRPWMVALTVGATLDYLTFPTRTPNHYSLTVVALTVQSMIWMAGWRLRLDGEASDRWVATAMTGLLLNAYFFAGLHKINTAFLSGDPQQSPAAYAMKVFLKSGGLTTTPRWLLVASAWATIATECLVPAAAVLSRSLRAPCLLILMAFHFPQASAMGTSDYAMGITAFYPLLLRPSEWRFLRRRWVVAPRRSIAGAGAAICLLLWFATDKETFVTAIPVVAIWGASAGALARLTWLRLRRRSSTHSPRR